VNFGLASYKRPSFGGLEQNLLPGLYPAVGFGIAGFLPAPL